VSRSSRPLALVVGALLAASAMPAALAAQQPVPSSPPQASADGITRLELSANRSIALQGPVAITKVTVANPDVADVVVVGEREVIVNGKVSGETDLLLFGAGYRRHYRVNVRTPSDRPQVVLGVKIAEVRRDALTQFGVNVLSRNGNARSGTGIFNTDAPFVPPTGAPGGSPGSSIALPASTGFASVLTDFGTRDLLAFIEAEQRRGNARILAEPTLMAANRDSASFLAGGEIPIPIAQPGLGGQTLITVVYREFGVKLQFVPEVLGDSLLRLRVRPEVSSLDYGNALLLSGFRIPALRTRRVETSVDVPTSRTLVISGLLNDERERVRTGVPLLSQLPVIGALFGSTRWQRNETELLIVVTPIVVDPRRPRPTDLLPLAPDTTLPAREVLKPRLRRPASPTPAAPASARP
jgi:pilus assembly protein CpaC